MFRDKEIIFLIDNNIYSGKINNMVFPPISATSVTECPFTREENRVTLDLNYVAAKQLSKRNIKKIRKKARIKT